MDDAPEPRHDSSGDEALSDEPSRPSRDLDGWEPEPRRRRPLYQTARLAGLLVVVLVTLVALAIVLPGLDRRTPPAALASPSPSAAAAPITQSPSPSFVRPTPTAEPTFLSHLVDRGENLTTIARLYHTTPRSIAFWNRATYPSLDPESEQYDPNNIQIGWRLQVMPGKVYDELAGSPRPSGSAAVTSPPPSVPASSPGASVPTTSGPSRVVSSGPRDTKLIGLTFDMGGRLDPAVDILTWLLSNAVPATVFPTGSQGTTNELGRPAMAIVRDHPEMFEMGNHSWSHPSFTELTPDQMRAELSRAEDALASFVGRTTKPWFRPPYGSWNDTVREVVGGEGWSYLAMWDIDTIDWRPTSEGGPTAVDIEARVLSKARGGSIVLMHLGGWNTLEALPTIISGLREKDLEPVTLTELLAG
jgi:peptidoglycan/xylan/chitin deacetylase (PgdA/CDA1 family)